MLAAQAFQAIGGDFFFVPNGSRRLFSNHRFANPFIDLFAQENLPFSSPAAIAGRLLEGLAEDGKVASMGRTNKPVNDFSAMDADVDMKDGLTGSPPPVVDFLQHLLSQACGPNRILMLIGIGLGTAEHRVH